MSSLYVLGFALFLALAGSAQIPSPGMPESSPGKLLRLGPNALVQVEDSYAYDEERRFGQLNAARRKSIVADAEKLLLLANELQAEVAAVHPGALTPNQLRKVAQIEKLARSVRERMVILMGESAVFPQNFSLGLP